MSSKRILFTFDSKSLKALDKLVELGNYDTLADAVRDSVKTMAIITEAEKEGKVEIIQSVEKYGKIEKKKLLIK
tara:strand:- start:17057 stop:17278 length:222 start_codon:yes stop_codon:yes gene_type:complete